MAESSKTSTADDRSPNDDGGEWKVVLPRRGRRRNRLSNFKNEDEQIPWSPTDQANDPIRESKILRKTQICIKKIENSEFYRTFINQLKTAPVLDFLNRVLSSVPKLGMILYGVGSIESSENSRLQLSLAILLKQKCSWIENIEVFDPILSATECRILESFGCSILSVNEQGRRRVQKPTFFFMPHCEAVLYNNLLRENWTVELLNHIVLLGNSFEAYEGHIADLKNALINVSAEYILHSRKFIHEFKLKTTPNDYLSAFHDLSWHFFRPVSSTELQFKDMPSS